MNRELRFRLAVDGAQQSSAAVDNLSGSFGRLEGSLAAAHASNAQLVAGFGRLVGVSLAGGALTGSILAVRKLGEVLFDASVNAEKLRVQLNFAGTAGGPREYEYVAQLAQRLGLQLNATADSYAKFAAASRGTALEGAKARAIFESVSGAAAVMGLNVEEATGVLRALQQMVSKGTVSAEELRLQLGDRLPGAMQIAARAMGVTTQQLARMVEQGQVVSDDFLPRFAEQLRTELGPAVEQAADRLQASTQRMANAWERLKQAVGDAGVSRAIAGAAERMSNDMTAVREAMTAAERNGGGALRRLNDGAGMLIGRSLGLQNLSRDFMTLRGAIEDARATIDRLDAQERAQGRLSIYAMDERARAMRDLARASRELAAQSPFAGSGSIGSGDTALRRAQAADLERRQVLAEELRGKLATPAEKLAAELNRQRALLGDQFTPELEQRLRDSFVKPTKEARSEAEKFTDSLDAQAAKLREHVIEMTAGAEAALAFRAAQLGIGSATAAQRAEVAALTAAVKRQADEQTKAKEAAEARAKADAEALRARIRYAEELDKQLAGEQQATQALRDELLALTAGEQALRDLTAARADEAAVAAERLALARYDLTRDDEELRKLQAIARELRNQAALRRQIGDAAADKEATERATQEWQRASDQIGQSLADALMGGAQSAAEAMKNLFRTLVLRPVIQAVVNPVAGAITSVLGFGSGTANAAGSGGSGVGGIGNLLSLAGGALGTFGSAAGVGLGATLGGAGLGEVLAGAGAMLGQGTAAGIAGGLGLGLGAIAPYVAAAAAVYYLGKAAFGRKLADTGVQGTFSGAGDFTGNAYAFYKGGWFRSDKTTTSPLDEGLGAIFDAGAKAVSQSARSYADALGLPASAIDGYSKQIQISLSGLNEQQIREKIEQAVAGFGQGLAERFAQQLDPFAKAGETLAQTFERLAGIQTFSRTLNELGGVFERVAWLSIDAREHLFDLAGGMQALGQQAMQFVQDYYGRDEIAGIKADEIQARLAAVGITQDIASREQFRALVDSLDVSSAKGREQLATLLAASGSFTGLSDYLAETGLTLQQAAAQAPDAGPLPGLFGPGGQLEQISAINNVALSVDRVYGAVMEVVGAIKAQPAPPPIVFQPWEVGGMAVSGGT